MGRTGVINRAEHDIYYRPQRSCEGYVFTRVCHSVHRGGGWGVLSQHALQVVSQHTLHQVSGREGGVCSQGGRVWIPPRKQTATVAEGTHPTGMHSSCKYNYIISAKRTAEKYF